MGSPFQEEFQAPVMESVASLAENVVFRVPGCSDLMVRKTLQSVYQDFARLACCFVAWQKVVQEADEGDYHVRAMFSGMYVSAISDVKLDGRSLKRDKEYEVFNVGNAPSIRLRGFLEGPCVRDHRFDPRFARHDLKPTLAVRTIEQPNYNTEKAPRWFLERYGEALVAGTLAKLFGMTNRPWSDEAQMRAEQVRYENFATTARMNSFSADGSQFGNASADGVDTSVLL